MADRYLYNYEAQISGLTGTAAADYPAWTETAKFAYDDLARGKAGGSYETKVYRCILANTGVAANEPGEGSDQAEYWEETVPGFVEGINQWSLRGQSTNVDGSAGYDDYSLTQPGPKSGTIGYYVKKGGGTAQKLMVEGAQFVIQIWYGGRTATGTKWDKCQITPGAPEENPQKGQFHSVSFPFTVQGTVATGYVA